MRDFGAVARGVRWGVLCGLGALGMLFVVAPGLARGVLTSVQLLDPLPAAAELPEARAYVDFVYGVLGAVLVGWAVLMGAVLWPGGDEGRAWAGVLASLAVWFVLDTGMSLATGHPRNALLNAVTLVALGVPHLLARGRWGRDGPGSEDG